MFPSPKLGLSLKLIRPTRKLLRARFPSPKLGLSLKFNFEKYINAVDEKFPSPKLGLSLKSCPCKSACHKACAHHLRRKPYQQTTCPKNNLPHTLQIHSASGAAQFHSKSFIQ